MPKITVLPDNKVFEVNIGDNLYASLIEQQVEINAFCGGNGTCGKCKVKLETGSLAGEALEADYYLACKSRVNEDVTISIPRSKDAAQRKSSLYDKVEVAVQSQVQKLYLELPKPSIEDQTPDWERLRAHLPSGVDYQLGLELLIRLPHILRQGQFKVTVVISGNEIIAIEAGNTVDKLFGVAFDIGTTSIVGFLLDLHTGEKLAIQSVGNPQRSVGADVISRIEYVNNNPEGSKFLQDKVVGALNDLIEGLLQATGIERDFVYEATVVGNTTMQHLLLGINPGNLARAPYIPALKSGLYLEARRLGIRLATGGKVYVLPNIAGFVGSDTVGAILATNLHEQEQIKLMIDIGTNGEVALGSKAGIKVCSTAAGPAFEGAQIQFGMRAADGAIEAITLSPQGVDYRVIGQSSPVLGICGSGLIQGIAELVKHGVVSASGRMLTPEDAEAQLPPALAERVHMFEEQAAFLLVPESQAQRAIYITQKDIRELQLAKGAIAAGIEILTKEMGIGLEAITEILLAGAFGSYIDRASAKLIGLVPSLDLEQIKVVGNAAGQGSTWALLSTEFRAKAEQIAGMSTNIELSSRPDFQDLFIQKLMF